MRYPFAFIGLFAAALLIPLAGCSNETKTSETKPTYIVKKAVKRTPLEAKAFTGIIRGKVVYDGTPPIMPFLQRINDHGDKAGCLQGGPAETHKETWIVDLKTKAVANVVVWLDPPAGKYFTLSAKDKRRTGEVVVIDQPHCVFVPHVIALFPSYFDGKDQIKTGQKLEIRNGAPFIHTVQWNRSRENDGFNGGNIPPKGGKQQFVLNPQRDCLVMGCGIHNWMTGIVWIFEHPFHAVTGPDGSFEIKNVPIDTEFTFKAWHETCIGSTPFEQRPLTVRAGANSPVEIAIKSKN